MTVSLPDALRGPLIGASELAAVLGRPDTVVVDCRFSLTAPEAGRQAFLEGHIPGARYAHLDRDLARPPARGEGRHPLPDPAELAHTLGRLSIGNTDLVVAYDDQSCAIAARLWWLLRWLGHERVAVLDGGLQAWMRAGGELAAGPERPTPTRDYRVTHVHEDWVAPTAEIETLDASAWRLVDARSSARFAGAEEPIDPVAGHVPGALSWPFTQSVAGDGRLRTPDELAAVLEGLELPPGMGLIAMCGSGVTACHLLLAWAVLGRHGRLYPGSWSEWIRDPRRPIARG